MNRPALDEALHRIGDRWTLLIIDALGEGPSRFGDLSQWVTGIAPNVLAARLRQLDAQGVVTSSPYSERPRRLEYRLTELGRELSGALSMLAAWGSKLVDAPGDHHHVTCGTPLEVRLWCPTCDRVVEDAEASDDIPA